jgi:ubiquinone/menaquinone biosynthesis C-methylase UbiE
MPRSFLLAVAFLVPSLLFAQEKSVNPGINKSFVNPDVEQFIGRFENEGRDAFDHRMEIVKAIGLKPKMTVADIGAGTGLFTRLFGKEVGPEGSIYAVDIAEKFVKHVELTSQKAGLKNVTGVICKADAVNLPPASIDLAFICDTYHHFEFPLKTMRSIHKALKPEGQVILIDFHRTEGVSREWTLGHVRAGQEVFTKEIVEAGFRQVEEVKGMLDESYFVRFEKADSRADALPVEPVEIGTTPQFVFDNFIVDNHWAIKYKRESVKRVFHQPIKFESNPVIRGEGGYTTVIRDKQTGLFRMWYQTWIASPIEGKSGRYAIAYAESTDGVSWTLPKLGLFEWKGTKENNIVWTGLQGKRGSQVYMLDVPEEARRGFRFVMLYGGNGGSHLIGSQDGIHWDRDSDTVITKMHSDTQNAIVYDPRRKEYVMFCRAKHIYRTFRGDIIDTGASRRVARMSSSKLWTLWDSEPQNILVPDGKDEDAGFNFFYGMPTRYHAGIYWGFLWPFKMNTDIHTELAWSRDGFQFHRLPGRPKLIERGPEGSWDDGMVFNGYRWMEVGDEWWLYYAGWDGPHGTSERSPGIGLVKLRKEGFISMRGPGSSGGVISTRQMIWPGGKLLVNADASEGELSIRVTDRKRKTVPGFDYDDCTAFNGNDVAHELAWKESSMDSLTGQVVRFEFFLKDADLFTFRASGQSQQNQHTDAK